MKKIVLPFIVLLSQFSIAQSSSEMVADILGQYRMLQGNKALVVAIDEDRYAAGWGFQFSNTKKAIAKAMSGCQKSKMNYQVMAECSVYMINNKLQVSKVTNDTVSSTGNGEIIEEVVISTPSSETEVVQTDKLQHNSSVEAVVAEDEQMLSSVN